MPHHHERHAGADRGPEREQVGRVELRARAPDRHPGVVGVDPCSPEPGEVLRGRCDAAPAPSHDGCGRRATRSPWITGERASDKRGAGNARNVAHRGEAHRDPRGAQRHPRLPRRETGRTRSRLLGLGGERRRPGQHANDASLLVDCDNRSSSLPTEARGERAQLARRGDVVAEQDRAGHAPVLHCSAHVRGRGRAGEAEHHQLTHLLLERQRGDGRPRTRRRAAASSIARQRRRQREHGQYRDPGRRTDESS